MGAGGRRWCLPASCGGAGTALSLQNPSTWLQRNNRGEVCACGSKHRRPTGRATTVVEASARSVFTAAAPQSCHALAATTSSKRSPSDVSTYTCRNRYNLSDSRLDRVFLYQQRSHGSLRPRKLLAAVGRLARHRAAPPRVAILQLAATWLLGPRSVWREALRFVTVAVYRLESSTRERAKKKSEENAIVRFKIHEEGVEFLAGNVTHMEEDCRWKRPS